MDLLNGMLQKDQDEFRRICNKLINVCFICRQNQATRSDFYFIQKYKEKFEELLGVLGYGFTMPPHSVQRGTPVLFAIKSTA